MSETANDVRMTNAVQGYGLILEVLDKGSLKVRIEIVVEKDVEAFDDNEAVRRLLRRQGIPC